MAALALGAALALAGCTSAASPGAPSASDTPAAGTDVTPSDEPVPVPGGGDITETVAPVEPGAVVESTLDAPAVLPSDVTVSIAQVRRIDVEATSPGETPGPVAVATIRIENGTSSDLDLGSTVVTLVDGAGNPGRPTTAGPFNPFTESVPPGSSLEGVYVFGVPSGSISPIRISVSYAGGAPVALFAGDVS